MIASIAASLQLAKIALILLQISVALAAYPPEMVINRNITEPPNVSVSTNIPITDTAHKTASLAVISPLDASLASLSLSHKLSEKDQVKGKIRYFSSIYGVDENLAIKIADCESNLERYAKSPSSTAKSYFQFLDGTWKNTMIRMGLPINSDVFDEDTQIKAGTWLLKQDGTRHWLESRDCWS